MGLLDKALHGATTPIAASRDAGSGFFAKANAVRPEPSPEEGAAACPSILLGDLANLRFELLDLPMRSDYLPSVFTRLVEALPLDLLVLCLSEGEVLRPFASIGLPASITAARIPASVLPASLEPGTVLAGEHAKILSDAIGSTLPRETRVSGFTDNPGAPFDCVWLYSSPPGSFSDEASDNLGDILRSCSARASLTSSPAVPNGDPAVLLLGAIPPDHLAVAMLFRLDAFEERAQASFPSLCPGSATALVARAASPLLAGHGGCVELPGRRVALILVSSSPLDPELAVFQMGKSLARSFAFMEVGSSLPGEAFPIDPVEPGSQEALHRFIAG